MLISDYPFFRSQEMYFSLMSLFLKDLSSAAKACREKDLSASHSSARFLYSDIFKPFKLVDALLFKFFPLRVHQALRICSLIKEKIRFLLVQHVINEIHLITE